MKGIKDSTKDANRTGRTLSRTYVARRVSHEVIFVNWNKTYFGVCEPASNGGFGVGGAQLADRVAYDSMGLSFSTELGFQVSQNEEGAPWDPIWPDYSLDGQEIKNTVAAKVRELLLKLQKQMAEDVTSGAAP